MRRQLFQYHPTIGYHFVPELKARVEHESGGYLLRTNSSGFRCHHDFETVRADGFFRILLFGDSYTAGDGVSDHYRYSEVLERLLPGVEVYNFGLPGSGTDQQFLIWREFGRGIEHDLVVISIWVENIRRIVSRYRPFATREGKHLMIAKPYFVLQADGGLELRNVPVPRDPLPEETLPAGKLEYVDRGGRFPWLRSAVNRLGPGVKDQLQRLSGYQPLPGYDRRDHPTWCLLKTILERWLLEIKVPVVIFLIPLYHHIEETASPHGYQARFAELHRPPAVRVHDSLPDFQRVAVSERRAYRFEVDPHLTRPAHEVLAKSLAGVLKPLMKEACAFR